MVVNKKIYRHFANCALLIVSTVCSVLVSMWISERYFFDTLYYRKSTEHGYLPYDAPLASFGKRSEDLMKLRAFLTSGESNTLGSASGAQHTIVIIGDSYVWGQGVRNEDRFPVLLEKKLNAIASVKIVSLGRCGNNVFDNYTYFRDIQKMIPNIDGYIFALVENDLMFSLQIQDQNIRDSFVSNCHAPINFDTNRGLDTNETYERLLSASYSELSGNRCLFQQIIPLLPKKNAIYLAMEYLQSDDYLEKYIAPLQREGYYVVVPDYQSIIAYSDYAVSKKDGHPSKRMQKIYAEILYKEIVNTGMLSR